MNGRFAISWHSNNGPLRRAAKLPDGQNQQKLSSPICKNIPLSPSGKSVI
jgi:hypothetical protein